MTTTALEEWGQQQRADGADHVDTGGVDETDITSAALEDGEHQEPHSERDLDHVDEVDDDGASAAEAGALARKKKQGIQVIIAAAVVCGALVVGLVGFAITKRNATAQEQAPSQEAPAQQMAAGSQGQPQTDVMVAPGGGVASAPAQTIITERADGTAVGALAVPPAQDFGLQPDAGVQAPSPAVAIVAGALPEAAAPKGALPTSVDQNQAPAPIASKGVAAPVAAPALKSEVVVGELEKLRADVASLRADLAEKAGTVDALRSEVSTLQAKLGAKSATPRKIVASKSSTRQVARASTQGAESAKPATNSAVVVVTETVQANNNPVPVATIKGKVRGDFRIYAAVDGRFWVVGPDNEPVQIAVRSPLSDGSRVTSIDAHKNVVYTTAGEIR